MAFGELLVIVAWCACGLASSANDGEAGFHGRVASGWGQNEKGYNLYGCNPLNLLGSGERI